jgi:hypothetical protein
MSRWIALSTFVLSIGMTVAIWNDYEYQNKFIASAILSYIIFLLINEYEKNANKE